MALMAISRISQAAGGSTRFTRTTVYSQPEARPIRRCARFVCRCSFSLEACFWQALELSGEGDESTATGEDHSRMSTPGITTVIVPPAPRTEVLTAAQQKKNRDREYQRKKRAEKRRSTATPASDDESVQGRKPTKRARLADDD